MHDRKPRFARLAQWVIRKMALSRVTTVPNCRNHSAKTTVDVIVDKERVWCRGRLVLTAHYPSLFKLSAFAGTDFGSSASLWPSGISTIAPGW